eukprot:COSAG05_NODE_137_length_16843_cov_121.090779_9_plen_74_part_00
MTACPRLVFEVYTFFWDRFRKNYKQTIKAVHSGMKLPIRARRSRQLDFAARWPNGATLSAKQAETAPRALNLA